MIYHHLLYYVPMYIINDNLSYTFNNLFNKITRMLNYL